MDPKVTFRTTTVGMTKSQARGCFKAIFTAEEIATVLGLLTSAIKIHKKELDSGKLPKDIADKHEQLIQNGCSSLTKIAGPFGGDLAKGVYAHLGKSCGIHIQVLEEAEEEA